jgi:hypothetical protein
VTSFLELPHPFLLLLPLAMAAGAEMYLTFLVLGLTAWLGGWPLEPGALNPLGSPAPLVFFAVLYLAEGAAELRPLPALAWHNAQLAIRPMGGFLLGLLLLEGMEPRMVLLGAASAAVVTALVHVLSWGQGLLLRLLRPGKVSPVTLNFFLDTCALALVVLTLEDPGWGFLTSLLLLSALLILGHPLHGVTRFGFGLFWEGLWGFSSPSPWVTSDEMPRWVEKAAAEEHGGGFRGTRAGAWHLPGVRGFRDGWLVEQGPARFFLFRSTGGARKVSLEMLEAAEERVGPLALQLTPRGPEGKRWALFLQKKAARSESHKSR